MPSAASSTAASPEAGSPARAHHPPGQRRSPWAAVWTTHAGLPGARAGDRSPASWRPGARRGTRLQGQALARARASAAGRAGRTCSDEVMRPAKTSPPTPAGPTRPLLPKARFRRPRSESSCPRRQLQQPLPRPRRPPRASTTAALATAAPVEPRPHRPAPAQAVAVLAPGQRLRHLAHRRYPQGPPGSTPSGTRVARRRPGRGGDRALPGPGRPRPPSRPSTVLRGALRDDLRLRHQPLPLAGVLRQRHDHGAADRLLRRRSRASRP